MARGAPHSLSNYPSLPQRVLEPLGSASELPPWSQEAAVNGSTIWPPAEVVLLLRGGGRFAEEGEQAQIKVRVLVTRQAGQSSGEA